MSGATDLINRVNPSFYAFKHFLPNSEKSKTYIRFNEYFRFFLFKALGVPVAASASTGRPARPPVGGAHYEWVDMQLQREWRKGAT